MYNAIIHNYYSIYRHTCTNVNVNTCIIHIHRDNGYMHVLGSCSRWSMILQGTEVLWTTELLHFKGPVTSEGGRTHHNGRERGTVRKSRGLELTQN